MGIIYPKWISLHHQPSPIAEKHSPTQRTSWKHGVSKEGLEFPKRGSDGLRKDVPKRRKWMDQRWTDQWAGFTPKIYTPFISIGYNPFICWVESIAILHDVDIHGNRYCAVFRAGRRNCSRKWNLAWIPVFAEPVYGVTLVRDTSAEIFDPACQGQEPSQGFFRALHFGLAAVGEENASAQCATPVVQSLWRPIINIDLCLGILKKAHYKPHRTGEYNPLYTIEKNQGFGNHQLDGGCPPLDDP